MPIRITGMNSGLDTESIITELVKAKATKKDSLVKAQTKLQWKQDAWKELNAKVYSLYSKTLSNMRLKSDYSKKATKVSDESVASVITGAKAVNGVQTLKVTELATTGYLTGAELQKDGKKASYKSTDKLTDLGVEVGSEFELKVDGKTTKITVDSEMTVESFVKKLQKEGLNASFDEKNQRFFISSKESGADADFALTASDIRGMNALKALGIAAPLSDDDASRNTYLQYCEKVEVGQDANGNKLYKYQKLDGSSDVILKMVDDEVNNIQIKYTDSKVELETVKEEIDEIKDRYTEDDSLKLPSKNDLETELSKKKSDLEKNKTLTSDERTALENEIKKLEKKLEDRTSLDELENREKELNSYITEHEMYFSGSKIEITLEDGTKKEVYYADQKDAEGDYLLWKVSDEVNNKAAFAEDVLNGVYTSSGATRIAGQDAKITLNGAEFTSNSNTFEINGLTITAQSKSDKEITITTSDDTDGIYDMVKDFLKEYNELINEMDKLYNADSSKGYEPLTEEEKEAMSEKEIEKWEEKIKNSILRRDSTLSTVAGAMKQVMLQGVKMSDGSQMYLSDFGINTLGYFTAKDNEKNAYHIDGNPDDPASMSNADKLKTAIANDPEQVIEFFSSLTMSLYNKLGDLMKKTEYSSSFTLYDDVAMKNEYKDYTDKITKQEKKITDFEDRYYKKFSAMETALAKLSSKESAVAGLIGM